MSLSSSSQPAALRADYSPGELMVVAAAREIREGEWVFVGMRLPLLAFLLAKRMHAPRAVGLYENGVMRSTPARELLYTMADPPNLRGATFCGQMLDVMALLQQGRVDVGFLGAAEIDRFGNLNTTWVETEDGRPFRMPGSGGACDIACLARRLVILMTHDRRRLRERVRYRTSPGFGDGGDWREQRGLPRGGPATLITTKAIFHFDGDAGAAKLVSVHPGVTVEDVMASTGWPCAVDGELPQTPAPSPEALAIIRELDPHRYWTN